MGQPCLWPPSQPNQRVHLKRQRDEATCGQKRWAGTEGRSGTPGAMPPLQEGKKRCRELESPLSKVSIKAQPGRACEHMPREDTSAEVGEAAAGSQGTRPVSSDTLHHRALRSPLSVWASVSLPVKAPSSRK